MERLFKLKERGTTVRTEVIAGLTTFITMAYILAVNPNILGDAGMDRGAVFTATAIASALATFVMAFLANYPIALSAGMGLNAYFAYTVCLGELADVANPWTIALTAVLVEGVIFMILSIFKFRETIVNSIPKNLKFGITAGIGLFIAFIGLQGSNVIVANDATLVAMGDFSTPQVALCLIGLAIIAVMNHFKIRGSILWGILATWLLGIGAELIGWYPVDAAAGLPSLIPVITAQSFIPPSIAPTFMKFDFAWVSSNFLPFLAIVFAFLYVDIFDTVGTVIGVADKANLLDKDGKLPGVGKVLMADAVGTAAGACLGTSTITSFVESSAGAVEGGKTGLTAFTTACMFLVALFFSPVFLAIPGFATAPALIFVGMQMMSAVTKMSFDGDMADTISGYMAILMMVVSYSIANGIMFGVLFWIVIKIFTGKIRDIHPIMYVITALFITRIITLVI